MDVTAKRQELPPPGGYKNITYERIPAKTYFKGRTMFLGYSVILLGGVWAYIRAALEVQDIEREYAGATNALMALYLSENQRIQLKLLRKNRDIERELMKDVEGWKVGTLYGEPIFKSTDYLVPYESPHLYIHSTYKAFKKAFSVKDLLP